MNFVLGFDDAYCPYADAVITSVCKNNHGNHHFYVITDYISEDKKTKICHDVYELGASITFYEVNQSTLSLFPLGSNMANRYVSIATYFRLFMVELLPQDITRIIYLDCDLIVDSSLELMWNWQFSNGKCILAAEDEPNNAIQSAKRIGYNPLFSYFNAGVFMADLKLLRKIITYDKISLYISKNLNKIKFHDQDLLNAFLHDKRDILPIEYNMLEVYYKRNPHIPKVYNSVKIEIIKNNPVIVHYSGPIKPWHIECHHPLNYKFIYYIEQTSFSSCVKHRKYASSKDRMIFFTKNILKNILELLHIKYYSYA